MSDFGEILYTEAERHADIGHMIKTASFQIPTWRTAAILKTVKLPYPIENVVESIGVLHHVLNLMRFTKTLSQNLRCDKVTINE